MERPWVREKGKEKKGEQVNTKDDDSKMERQLVIKCCNAAVISVTGHTGLRTAESVEGRQD